MDWASILYSYISIYLSNRGDLLSTFRMISPKQSLGSICYGNFRMFAAQEQTRVCEIHLLQKHVLDVMLFYKRSSYIYQLNIDDLYISKYLYKSSLILSYTILGCGVTYICAQF